MAVKIVLASCLRAHLLQVTRKTSTICIWHTAQAIGNKAKHHCLNAVLPTKQCLITKHVQTLLLFFFRKCNQGKGSPCAQIEQCLNANMGFLSSDKIQEKKKKSELKHEHGCTSIWLSSHIALLNKTLFTVAN